MAKKLYEESNIQDIAKAIREKNGSAETYTTAEMSSAIRAIKTESGGEVSVDGEKILDNTVIKIESSVTSIRANACRDLTSLVTALFDSAVSVGANAFYGCTNLKTFSGKSLSGTSGSAANLFHSCTALEIADLGSASALQSNTFYNCSSLKEVILRNPTVVTLSNISTFNGTPFASGGSSGTIYVPKALIGSYQTATGNWATVIGYGTITFESLEDSEYA